MELNASIKNIQPMITKNYTQIRGIYLIDELGKNYLMFRKFVGKNL